MAQEKTKTKILRIALRLFMEHGFAGTSMNQIAQAARVTKSLIYHHFDNKQALWRAVKLDLVQSYAQGVEVSSFSTDSLEQFIRDAITFRFNFYARRPEIVRLMMWQRLEKEQDSLKGVSHPVFASFMPQILELQRIGLLNPNLHPDMVEYLIMSLASNPIIDNPEFLCGQLASKSAQDYLELLIDGLIKMLAGPH